MKRRISGISNSKNTELTLDELISLIDGCLKKDNSAICKGLYINKKDKKLSYCEDVVMMDGWKPYFNDETPFIRKKKYWNEIHLPFTSLVDCFRRNPSWSFLSKRDEIEYFVKLAHNLYGKKEEKYDTIFFPLPKNINYAGDIFKRLFSSSTYFCFKFHFPTWYEVLSNYCEGDLFKKISKTISMEGDKKSMSIFSFRQIDESDWDSLKIRNEEDSDVFPIIEIREKVNNKNILVVDFKNQNGKMSKEAEKIIKVYKPNKADILIL